MITNIKKIIILCFLFTLSSCKRVERNDFYVLTVGNNSVAVGYDSSTFLSDYEIYSDDKTEYVSKVVLYLDDVDSSVSIDDYVLNKGIKETCSDLDGEYLEKNGHVCLISKRVNKHDNYVLLYSDILDDDIDKIDRVEVYYK